MSIPGRSSAALLLSAGAHGAAFVVPVLLPALVWVVVARVARADAFVRLHAAAATRLQLVCGVVAAVALLPANLPERTGRLAPDLPTGQLLSLLAAATLVYGAVVSVLWLVDAAGQRLPRRTVGPAAVLVTRVQTVTTGAGADAR